MAEQIKTKQVTAVVKSVPKKKDWPGIEAAKKTAGNLGKNQELFDKIVDLMANVLSEAYNVKPNDPKMMSEINTIVKAVSQAVVSNLSNKSSDSLTENQVKEIVSKIVSNGVKESNLSKEQYQKLVDDITSEVQSYASEVNKHKALLENIKSQLNAASESLSKIVYNKTATEQKPSTQDKADKSKTDFNKQLASLTKMIQKINGICQSIASKQKDLSQSLSKFVKMLDATQSISNKIKDQVKQSAKIQTDVKNITTTGFNQTEKQIKDVNEAVEEVNENVKNISFSRSTLGILGGGFGIAVKVLSQLGKVLILGPIKFIGKYILGPIVGFVGSAIKGIGGLLLAPIKLIGKGLGKVLDGIANVAAKSFGAFIMSPAGMYTIGFIAGFVWTMWLKDWWEKINNFFNSETWDSIKTTVSNIFSWCIDFFKSISWQSIVDSLSISKKNYDDYIKPTLDFLGNGLSIMKDNVISIFNSISKLFSTEFWDEIFDRVFSWMYEFIDSVKKNGFLKTMEIMIVQPLISSIKGLFEDIKSAIDSLKNLFSFIFEDKIKEYNEAQTNSMELAAKQTLDKVNKMSDSELDEYRKEKIDATEEENMLTLAKLIEDTKKEKEEFESKSIFERKRAVWLDGEKDVDEYEIDLHTLNEELRIKLAKLGFNSIDEFNKYVENKKDINQQIDQQTTNQQAVEAVNSAVQQVKVTEGNLHLANFNDSIFIGSGWQSIDKKWIYGYDGENNDEYARAVKKGTPIVQANTTLSKDQLQQLFTRQQGIKVEDVAFDNLQSALNESGLDIGGAADVESSNKLAKNIADYLSNTQQQIDAMPAEEQRAWQRKLNETIYKLIETINKKQPQQNLMYMQIGQPILNPANYDK